MDKKQLKNLIKRVLSEIGQYSENAENLLIGTCAQESGLGKYRRQLGGGPALGIFQMEPATFRDICDNFLRYKPDLQSKIKQAAGVSFFDCNDLINNDALAICFARVHYLRVKESIPGDLPGWAGYWKKYYNTPLGKGKEDEFIANFKRYVL